MPDIGLLQGPPRAKLIIVPRPIVEPVVDMAPEEEAIKVAAHAAVVSERRPMAEVTSEILVDVPDFDVPVIVEEPVPAQANEIATAAFVPAEPVVTRAGVVEPVIAASPPVVSEAAAVIAQPAPVFIASAVSSASPEPSAPAGEAPRFTLPVAPAPNYSPPPIRLGDLLWLLLALALIIGTGLGIREPWPADEPRFVSIARDMVSSGEWLFPHVGGDLYQDKPPVFFWMLALCYTLFGAWKGWFLIPAFLAAGGVLFLVYDFGRRTVGREAGLAAAVITLCSLQFVLAMRGAQIDPVLCLLTTFSVYALLRHLLLGDGWKWYLLAGFAAGLGVITKGVGFLPMLLLIPYFALRAFRWKGLAAIDAGVAGWRWWLAPIAMLVAISLWFVPMLIGAASGPPEYAAYRDEILFKQTVGRYAAAWHHVKGWYYFLVEVIPPLWLPWSILLVWLAPRFKAAFQERDARVWLPLFWVALVVLFFSMSPGKRGIYILPALPVLAMASLPLLSGVLARRGVRIAGYVLAIGFFVAALALAIGHATGAEFAVKALTEANLAGPQALYVYLALCGIGLIVAFWRAPLLAWPVALGALALTFSYFIAPAMNGERSGRDFTTNMVTRVKPGEQLALAAYKEQFLLYLDRPVVNFGHRRWQEGRQEYFDASAWLAAAPDRVLLVPADALVPSKRVDKTQPAIPCFTANIAQAGETSGDGWFLVRAPADPACVALGKPERAITYVPR